MESPKATNGHRRPFATHLVPQFAASKLQLAAHRSVRRARGRQHLVVGQAFADVATIGLLQERAVQERSLLAEQLQPAHNSRVLIEQAKGVLSERADMTVDRTFTVMRAYARTKGLKLTSVAPQVIDGSLQGAELQLT